MPLESLTPSFDEKQHGTYLRRLEEAVSEPRNRNIALTGRYGAGKSSVLDKFEANHAESTLRLAISTLAPGEDSMRGGSGSHWPGTGAARVEPEAVASRAGAGRERTCRRSASVGGERTRA